jgi:phosphopantetheinyl transferase (holo-ACP synthase)
MIFGVGIDLVNIPRMEAVLRRWGDRFVKRVFTEQEAQAAIKGLIPLHLLPFALPPRRPSQRLSVWE